MDKIKKSLCFRCEYRALFLETGYKPRLECGSVEDSKYICYMYKPVEPVVLEKSSSEKALEKKYGVERPIGGMLGGRMQVSDKQEDFVTVVDVLDENRFLITNVLKKE